MIVNIKKREWFSVLILSIMILIINVNPLMVNACIYSISSKIEKTRVEYLTQEYLVGYSEHFVYKYTKADKDVINIVKNIAERSYTDLSKTFGYNSNEKITLIIFHDIESMNSTLRLPKNQKSMGLYYSGFISILSPKAWTREKNIQKVSDTFSKEGPIVHELTHYFVDKKTKGNYPTWFTEGVSLYFEKKFTGFEWGKGLKYQPYTIEQLTNNFNELDPDYAYRRSYEIILDYVNKNGEIKLLNIMDRLGEGYSLKDFGN